MKTKIVYVVVSNERDIYLEQFYVSIKSLRQNSPDTFVTLLTDELTAETFIGIRGKISLEANEIVKISLPRELSGQARSRLLKTSIREYISGDFLFIDCDTLILKSLDSIDACQYEIAACIDSHSDLRNNPYKTMILNHGKIVGINFKEDKEYFNSGVIYVKDTPLCHKFFQLWNKYWKEGFEKGVKMDQPSFNKTNYELNFPIKILSDDWNCELKHGVKYLNDPFILHYLCTNVSALDDPQVYIMNDKEKLLKIKDTGIIPDEIICCFNNHFNGFGNNTQIISGIDIKINHSLSYYLLKKYHNSLFIKCIEHLFQETIKLKDKLR